MSEREVDVNDFFAGEAKKYSAEELRGLNPGLSDTSKKAELSHIPDLLTSTAPDALPRSVSVEDILSTSGGSLLPPSMSPKAMDKPKPPMVFTDTDAPPSPPDSNPLADIQAALLDVDSPRYSQAVRRVQSSMIKLVNDRTNAFDDVLVGKVASIIHQTAVKASKPCVLADAVKETLVATKQMALKHGQALHAAVLDKCQHTFEHRNHHAMPKQEWLNLLCFLGELFNRGLLSDQILTFCIAELLGLPRRHGRIVASHPIDSDLEAVAVLLTTCGKLMESKLNEYMVLSFFDRLAHFQQISTHPVLKDVLAGPLIARKAGWPAMSGPTMPMPPPEAPPAPPSPPAVPAPPVEPAPRPPQLPPQTLPSPQPSPHSIHGARSLPSPHGHLTAEKVPQMPAPQSMPASVPSSVPSSLASPHQPHPISTGLGSHELAQLQQQLLQQQQQQQAKVASPTVVDRLKAAGVAPEALVNGQPVPPTVQLMQDDEPEREKPSLNPSAPAFVPGMMTGCRTFEGQPESAESSKDRTVYVVGIDTSLPEKVLLDFVQSCGRLLKIRLCGDTNNRTIYGFFEYRTRSEAQSLMDQDKKSLGKYILNCSWAKSAIRDAMTGSANTKVSGVRCPTTQVRNFRFHYDDEESIEATELRESCLQQKNWMPRGRKRDEDQKKDQAVAENYYRQRSPITLTTDGPPVLVKKKGVTSPSSSSRGLSGDDEVLSPHSGGQLLKRLEVPPGVHETAEALLGALGSDSSKDVQSVRQVFVGCLNLEDTEPLDAAIRALVIAVLSDDPVKKSLPYRLLQACSKASRISAYKCWSEVFRDIINVKGWHLHRKLWPSIADVLADCVVQQPEPLLQRTSLADLCAPIRRTPEWEAFRMAMVEAFARHNVDSLVLDQMLPN